MPKTTQRTTRVTPLAALYVALAFAWSGFAFASVHPGGYTPEYGSTFLVLEVGGHLAFGALVGLFASDVQLFVLISAESVLIDVDHLFNTFVAPVLDRPAHSLPYVLMASLALGYAARGKGRFNMAVAVATLAAFLSHLSYDTFVENGRFPLLVPFDFTVFNFTYWGWVPLELGAMAMAYYAGRRSRGNTP